MLRKSSAREAVPQSQYFCTKIQFLQPKNYKLMYENTLKLNKAYEIYSQTIQNNFKALHQYCSGIKQPNQQSILFLYYFKKYLYDYTRIMARITDYQLSCFEANRQNAYDDSLSMALHLVIQNAKKYAPEQKQIREKKQTLTRQFTAIKGQYMNIQKKMKKPKYYYDKKYMRTQFQPLKAKISTNQKGQQQILNQITKVNQNTINFLSQIDYFRKQLLKNKYKLHKKFVDLALNSKQSLAELFFYQYNCFNDYYQTITNAMQNEEDKFSMLRKSDQTYKNLASDPSGCINMVMKNTEKFLSLILSIEVDLKNTEKNFQMISRRLKQLQQKGLTKHSFHSINKFFQTDESPSQIILETLNAFEYCFRKLAQKRMGCKKAAQDIQAIRKQVIKHKGITISLLKVRVNNGGLESVRNIANQALVTDECGVYQFMNTLDLKPVKIVVRTCLDKILVSFSQILSFFNQKNSSGRKLGVSDSMDLSYMQKSLTQIKKKRPVKDQLWLWDQHRKKVDTQFTLSRDLFIEVMNIYESFKDQGQINLDLQKYDCLCQALQQVGELFLSKKLIKFTSKVSERQLSIPIADVQQVVRKTKLVIQDSITIKTKIGQLVFRQFINSVQVLEALKQIIQGGGVTQTGNLQKRPKIQLTDAQKNSLQSQARKLEMQKIRPNVSQFQQVCSQTFELPIDQFYDLILSDKKFALTGKEHDSFIVYAMKKYNNKDFKITKFQPPGPKYYTLDENATFQNGPLVSQCTYDYFHILGMSVPFLPSQCANRDTRKVFWVNDKQLDYLIHSQTSGVPMSDNFYVQMVYKLKQQNQNTTMKVYGFIKFHKSFALKSTIQSSTWKQIRRGTKETLAEIQKCISIYKSLLSGEVVQIQAQPQTTAENPQKQLQRLKNRNMYLIIAVVLIVVLNLVVKLFF